MDPNELNPLAKQFPSNSIVKKQEEQKKRLEPIVDQPVTLKKKGFGTRVKEAIFVDDSGSIGGYIIRDIIVPTVRDTIYNIVTGGLSMALYSTPKASPKRNSGTGTYISYADYYNDGRYAPPKRIPQADRYRTQFDMRNIPVPSSDIGHQALEELADRMQVYGNASVQDLFDILRIGSAPATMVNYGWTDISTATVEFIRGEWLLRMPKIVQL